MDNRTERKVFKLPAVLEAPRERLSLPVPVSSTDFLSQLIAERPTQRKARVNEAVTAYDRGARITVRRMPAGYRKTIVT
jgi:hypothetical protein